MAVALIVIDVETRSSGMPVEQLRHVLDRVDRDADAADFARGQRMVGVVAHLRRQVERDAQAADALREQVAVALRSTPRRCRSPAYCRIVQSRPRYIVGWMPRVNGKSPGSPRASPGDQVSASGGRSNAGPEVTGSEARGAMHAF